MRYLFGEPNLLGEPDIGESDRRGDVPVVEESRRDASEQTRFYFSDPPTDSAGNRMLSYEPSREDSERL